MGTKTGMVRKEQTRCKRKRRIDDQDQKPKPRRRCLLCRSFLLLCPLRDTQAVIRWYPLTSSQANTCTAAFSHTRAHTPTHNEHVASSCSFPLSRPPEPE